MHKNVKLSNSPAKLSEVLAKLQQVSRDLERIHLASDENTDRVTVSDDELLKTAKSLAFIWNSRKSFVDHSLVIDPGWLILLNLKIAELSHEKTQISTVCMDSGAPATTALRWIKVLESNSLVQTEPDMHDGRRKFVFLTDSGSELMGRYLQNVRNFISTRGIIF